MYRTLSQDEDRTPGLLGVSEVLSRVHLGLQMGESEFDLHNPRRGCLGRVASPCKPTIGEAEIGRSLGLPASQPSLISEIWARERPISEEAMTPAVEA